MKKISAIVLLFALLATCPSMGARRVLKVLAIGNSFSQDAVEQYLYQLAYHSGDSLVIGNAYIGGCSIDRHIDEYAHNKADYAYRKVVGGRRKSTEKQRLDDIIRDEPWDIITFQQASGFSGQTASYKKLPVLMKHVRQVATNPAVRFAFHETWAYATTSTHKSFSKYKNSQATMYLAIREAVHQAAASAGLERIIPSGLAIQRVRQMIGDTLNRDGYHLSYGLGRYVAACTWCEFLTGRSVVGNRYRPRNVDGLSAAVAQLGAHQAMQMVRDSLKDARIAVAGCFYEFLPQRFEGSEAQYFDWDKKTGPAVKTNRDDDLTTGRLVSIASDARLTEMEKTYASPDFLVLDKAEKVQVMGTEKARTGTLPRNTGPESLQYGMPLPRLQVKRPEGGETTLQLPDKTPAVLVLLNQKQNEDEVMTYLSEILSLVKDARLMVIISSGTDEAQSLSRKLGKGIEVFSGKTFLKKIGAGKGLSAVLFDKKGKVSYAVGGWSVEKGDLLLRRLIELSRQ